MSIAERSKATKPIRLSDIQHDQEAECFAVLAKKVANRTKKDDPYLQCQFRDRHVSRDAMLWQDNRFFRLAQGWVEGQSFRIKARGSLHPKFGMQIILLDIRPTNDADHDDGFDLADLVTSSRFDVRVLWERIHEQVDKYVDDRYVKALILDLLDTHHESFQRLQAATSMHHAYTGGLLEHVWSMLRVALFLADHYARYYEELDPPLNRSVIVAATILHDIGKIRELEYAPVEAKYTTEGCLLGHVVMGRDMVREAAARIEGFPAETLLQIEHAILAHHGKKEFGAPIQPQTIEAYLVSAVDELDAKINAAARSLIDAEGEEPFGGKVYPLENRRFYRGARTAVPARDPIGPVDTHGEIARSDARRSSLD